MEMSIASFMSAPSAFAIVFVGFIIESGELRLPSPLLHQFKNFGVLIGPFTVLLDIHIDSIACKVM